MLKYLIHTPTGKNKKRKAWEPTQVYETATAIIEDKLLRLAVNLAFCCSLRAGETAGIDLSSIDIADHSFWITQEVQRVSDDALSILPKDEIIRVFPKLRPNTKTSMILKAPKTEGSVRKQYIPAPLMIEIVERLEEIRRNKEFFGAEYYDYGLLICRADGYPIDPKELNKLFKREQQRQRISNQIEFQGLRKSGQMHKVRLSQNNYQLVAESGGHSPEVLMSNYNEALEGEKRALADIVGSSYYGGASSNTGRQSVLSPAQTANISSPLETLLVDSISKNPALCDTLLRALGGTT